MNRNEMINTIGQKFLTHNIENDEWSYVAAAGIRENLVAKLGREPKHIKLDLRFFEPKSNVAVLVETKQNQKNSDLNQLEEYVKCEKALNPTIKIIAILANTTNDKIRVFKYDISPQNELKNETKLDSMEHYVSLFVVNKQNNREAVLKNTYSLNELLHKKDIDERLRSQFVGTLLLHIKDLVKNYSMSSNINESINKIRESIQMLDSKQIIAGVERTLEKLLNDSDNKDTKVRLLQKNILDNQKVRSLSSSEWCEIIEFIITKIYVYINETSDEGQDILNLFFIAFNKYTGKADKNQAFTPDHITEFMCQITGVNRDKVVFDATCGSASFLVQAMAKELVDCARDTDSKKEQELREKVTKYRIYGIEKEEVAFGLSVTNMLIHGDGNSNIKLGNCFYEKDFIKKADPDIFLMNPPYNAKPKDIPEHYKKDWKSDGKEDSTKGLVFVRFLSDCVRELNEERKSRGESPKMPKLAVLLPLACAIGSNNIIERQKEILLEENTLEAVFSLPNEIFYPGASANACCMLFTLGVPHKVSNKDTFFGYCKEDGFKKKKNLGRMEQFDKNNESKWKKIENEWIDSFKNRRVIEGKTAMVKVNYSDEWLCEAYMKTDYTKLEVSDFKKTLNNYLSYLVKEGGYI
ncbi:type I restriction endonuclease subunit M [Helicobacter sp. 12S02634-8]|uniref:HsdM family class I SAM-dependent methyltransferase n=1 Tax=Helicobacter sp. 12S02634-8 TaxID=1476199 RepID=UPI000BA603EB|nr:N-6 DNA methylase [Helicobacter sp. 12S02634-8]PAF46107.1 type I restriction endonuclease subunit M [Helicobacter sp. 12S02634-8]